MTTSGMVTIVTAGAETVIYLVVFSGQLSSPPLTVSFTVHCAQVLRCLVNDPDFLAES